MSERPRIALLHAMEASVGPCRAAFARHWPEAELVNVLDDDLPRERARDVPLTPALRARFVELMRYCHGTGAHGLLVTCSAFGPAIDEGRAELPIPVLKPNEAMMRAALALGPRIALVLTFPPSAATMVPELDALAEHAGLGRPACETVLVPDALIALQQGDEARHNALVAQAVSRLGDVDAVMLGQFSMARAREAAVAATRAPVLTAPDEAVLTMKARLHRPLPIL